MKMRFRSVFPQFAIAVILAAFAFHALRLECILANDTPQQNAIESKAIADGIIGTWVLVESDRPGTPSGIGCRLKSYTGTHWMVTQPDPETGQVVFHHGGRYTLEGDILSATTDFAGATTQRFIGQSERLKITIDGDTLKQIDLDRGIYNETWIRCKSTQ